MIYKVTFLFVIFLLLVSCEKEDFSWNLPKKPVVVTNDDIIYLDSSMTLLIKGDVIKDEGNPITQRGVVWSNSPNSSLSDNYTMNGTGTGVFLSEISGLIEKTTYYIRAYATNKVGTSYGEERIFIVPSKTPSVSTTIPSSITSNSALCGGNVTSEGESPVTQRGVVWSNSPNPTLSDNFTSNGTGSGMFSSSITGLSASTKYYIRAYATNSFGTSFGNQIEIQTMDPVPVLISTNPCKSLIGISSSFTHWHYGYYDFHPWSVATSGYIGNCFTSDGNFLGADAKSGYIEFPITMNGSGFLSFWIRSGTSGTWQANRIPGIYIDGVQISTPTVIGGQSEFNWQKIKTSTISEGNHLLKIQFFENGAAEYLLKVDEIEIWEYQ